MTPIKKAHDKFIRDLMSRKPVVQDFLRYYLDQELVNLLDLSTLEIKKDTFVDQELVEHFSDILYQLKFRNGQGNHQPFTGHCIEAVLIGCPVVVDEHSETVGTPITQNLQPHGLIMGQVLRQTLAAY